MRASKTAKGRVLLSFVEWLYAHCGDDDTLGDLALSALMDKEVNLDMGEKDFLAFVHGRLSTGLIDRNVLRIVDEAVVGYRSYSNRIKEAINLQTERTWLLDGKYKGGHQKRTYIA